MPEDDSDSITSNLPLRKSADTHSNSFGNKLLSLCKECNTCIVNGRIEPGNFTCYKITRNSFGASVVDYVISNYNLFSTFQSMSVLDITEFSDHCPIEFVMNVSDMNSDVHVN